MEEIERCKLLIENMPAVAWITNRSRSEYYISPSVKTVLGFTQQEILCQGRDFWHQRIHPEDLPKTKLAEAELFAQKSAYSVYFRIQHKKGHWIWLRDKVVSFYTEESENFAIGMLLDVTEQRETENRLIESQQRFFDLAENSTDWFWEFDENNIFTYSSPGVIRILGYQPEEVVGKSAFDFIPSPEKEKVAREFAESKNVHAPFSNLENVNLNKEGHVVFIESSGSPIFDAEGGFHGYRGIDRDISQRKKIESQLLHAQKMDAVGVLAGGIAHDFNSILAGIMGFTDLLEMKLPEDEKLKHYVASIQKASERAKHLVQQNLTYGRKADNTGRKRISLCTLMDETVSFMRASLPATICIKKHACCENDIVLADATQIQQVVVNLSTNAAHAIGDVHGEIGLHLVEESLDYKALLSQPGRFPGEYLKFTVSDTGSGISKDDLPRIFDPYFTTKPQGRGSGLGLSVVHGIMENHGGFIAVETGTDEGSAFHVYLPAVKKKDSDLSADAVENYPGNGETILFVDDEPLLLQVQQILLESMGYCVRSTTSSLEALQVFKEDPQAFDIVLTDQTMPAMTGEELAKAVKQIREDVPVIVCSGYNERMNEGRARQVGISAFLMKPVERKVLASTLWSVLNNRA